MKSKCIASYFGTIVKLGSRMLKNSSFLSFVALFLHCTMSTPSPKFEKCKHKIVIIIIIIIQQHESKMYIPGAYDPAIADIHSDAQPSIKNLARPKSAM